MTVDDLLYLLSLTGPFLSVSRLVGKERAQRLEKMVLSLLAQLWKLLPMLLRLGWALVLLYASFLAIGIFVQLLPEVLQTVIGLGALIFLVPLYRLQMRTAYDVISKVCTEWQQELGVRPPWPFSIV